MKSAFLHLPSTRFLFIWEFFYLGEKPILNIFDVSVPEFPKNGVFHNGPHNSI